VLERLLDEVSFNAPNLSGQTHDVEAADVDQRLGELSRNEDLSRFIL
jgi:ATP-dependent HslUV protease ATP-binding subunit HslU